ncbi:hypothetical protein COU18_00485 [Candidatus Kaiserbacteria bacterium CG10_big_fil_rev_8_21_14_0_10_51_14]|uniref:DUF5667 domain-containing protein n=1 Tax=Candidatus Kaiserbacteria bacterium CG10_big_fil_rev_8_21_14_0_10_51_14 TaxID=1974610 RepID=A0A2H0UCR2_9BACT|nr:MAG: hypothetical protein COU18_00485 [Candidatus Kaiserbacteria bacterium CG10_big_fil_rev_8_21_14_0_10_51_14]
MKSSNTFNTNEEREAAEFLKAATKITLGEASRTKVRGFLSEYARMRPVRGGDHIPQTILPRRRFFSRAYAMPAIAAMLILVVSGSTAAAAEAALPGDLLYSIKVHVTEEVRASLAGSSKARALWEMERAERRLAEAATLALAGELDNKVRTEIDAHIHKHIEAAGEDRVDLEAAEDTEGAAQVETNIRAILLARANILGEVRPAAIAAKVVARTEPAEDTDLMMMSVEVASDTPRVVPEKREAEEDEAISQGNRAAAKARIEATKKFLEKRHDRLTDDTREVAEVQLRAAVQALSSGETDAARGNRQEASVNFDSALQTVIGIQVLVAEPSELRENSGAADVEILFGE